MTYQTQLDVCNDMLATLGEAPLNTLEDGHPLIPAMVRAISMANWREQSKAWWFNRELTTLNPDNAGVIYLPSDTIRVDPSNPALDYVQRGRKLYQPYAPPTQDKYKFTSPVECWLVRCLPFEDLPAAAQTYVAYSAHLDFQRGYDGDPQKTDGLKLALRDAFLTLNAEHTRNLNINLLKRSSTASVLQQIAPMGLPLR